MKLNEIQKIVEETLPKIIEHYGLSKFKDCTPYVEYDTSIYARLSGEEDMEGEQNPDAEYCSMNNEIIIYYPKMENKQHVIETLVHEYQHYLQSPTWMSRYYKMGYGYSDHPYEVAAYNEEKNYKLFM